MSSRWFAAHVDRVEPGGVRLSPAQRSCTEELEKPVSDACCLFAARRGTTAVVLPDWALDSRLRSQTTVGR